MRFLALLLAAVVGTFGGVALQDQEWTRPKVIVRRVEVEKKAKPLEVLITEIPPKYAIDPLVIAAIVRQESGGRLDAVRFEPGQMDRARRVTGKKSEQQLRPYASSHGPLQIMGWWAPEFGLSSWTEFYDAETSVEVGSAILRRCLDKSKATTKYGKYRDGLKCWNGSEQYADTVLSSLGKLLIEERL